MAGPVGPEPSCPSGLTRFLKSLERMRHNLGADRLASRKGRIRCCHFRVFGGCSRRQPVSVTTIRSGWLSFCTGECEMKKTCDLWGVVL